MTEAILCVTPTDAEGRFFKTGPIGAVVVEFEIHTQDVIEF